jgi:hypothetical protein
MATLAELLRQGADKLVNLPSEAQRFITNPQAFTQLLTGNNPLPRETGFAAGATGLPAQDMSVLDPNQAPYMQGYSQGEPIGYAGMAAPFAAPAAVATAKALAPKAGMMAENYMVKQGMIQPLTAYHGTPHTIQGQFDINKVGTGEGAQAYGHGMYFAQNPAVATEYRKSLSGRTDLNQQPSDPAFIHAVESFREVGTPLERIPAEMKKAYKSATDKDIQLAIQATEKGNLYKVDIPDADIPMMLDYDKPLSQQTPEVQKILKNMGMTVEMTGQDIYRFMPEQMQAQNLNFSKRPTDADVSKYLSEQGIKGIRYLDAGSRPTNVIDKRLEDLYQKHNGDIEKAADDFMRTIHDSPKKKTEIRAGIIQDLQNRPTSNFVVFDPSNVKILEKNNKPVTRKDLIEKQVKALKE